MGLFSDLVGSAESVPAIKDDTPHYEAVGRFVTSFAGAEGAVHMLARHLSGLPDQKARIIFGGMRLNDVMKIVRDMAKIDNLPAETFAVIDSCLAQLNAIAMRRHNIVHQSSIFFDGKLLSSDAFTSRSATIIRRDSFNVKELSDMQSDCGRIYLRLARIFLPDSELRPTQTSSTLEDVIYRSAWRYKPAPPKTPNLKPRSKSAKHKRPASRI
jgi:hypothetical protein